jgi:hypothetical protein
MSEYVISYTPGKRGSDGVITITRPGCEVQQRPANEAGVEWARNYAQAAREKGFAVQDSALAKLTKARAR